MSPLKLSPRSSTGTPRSHGGETDLAVTGRHLPALDGLRALAILGVVAYHLNMGWASGGYLGVDLFFVLSGFLITSLLLEEHVTTGRIHLASFWGRRARRLLPALFLVLIAVAGYAVVTTRFSSPTTTGAAIDLNGLRGDALATLLYFANWQAIWTHSSYFAQYSAPSPLEHTWSLAIEEQFYLLWPFVVLFLLKVGRRRWRSFSAALVLAGVLGSSLEMALLFHANSDPSRIYFGTDTRAFDLLVGALVALLAAARPQPGPRARAVLHGVALPAVIVLGAFWATAGTGAGTPRSIMWRGGFLLCAVMAAAIIADARLRQPGLLGNALSIGPMQWIGRISYGLYLWHWPVIVYLNASRTGLSGGPLDIVRLAVMFALSTVSYYLLELPIRRRRTWGVRRVLLAPAAGVMTAVIIVAATSPAIALPPVPTHFAAANFPGTGLHVPGVGGLANQRHIALPTGVVVDRAHPLRVLTVGDSVMEFAEIGLTSSLEATGEVSVSERASPGWGLTKRASRSGLLQLIEKVRPQLVIGTWLNDNAEAKKHPVRYRRLLRRTIEQVLSPGTGVEGVIFLQMPALAPSASGLSPAGLTRLRQEAAGRSIWNQDVEAAATAFPGRVMFFPVATSVELHGRYATWLPAGDNPRAPLSRWVRVRPLDGVHLCPAGITRFAAPVLEDLVEMFHLSPAHGSWWLSPLIEDASDAISRGVIFCPDDHPSSLAQT